MGICVRKGIQDFPGTRNWNDVVLHTVDEQYWDIELGKTLEVQWKLGAVAVTGCDNFLEAVRGGVIERGLVA